jgi:prepilin peptidase CpaA
MNALSSLIKNETKFEAFFSGKRPASLRRNRLLAGEGGKAVIESLILVVLVVVLAYVVLDDFRNLRIRNEVVLGLALLFLLKVALAGDYRLGLSHAAFALVMTALVLAFYAKGAMGGGDVKLLGVAFLWLGAENSFAFSLALLAVTLAYLLLARLGALPKHEVAKRTKIPFGPCIAAAWLLTALPWGTVSHLIGWPRP